VHEIRDFIERDGVYVGTSAGSIIMGPDIDENLTSPGNDCGLEDLDGFGYFNFYVIPHWDTKDGDLLTRIVTYSWKTDKRIIALTDQQAILVIDNEFRII